MAEDDRPPEDPTGLTRREALQIGGVVAVGTLAGCSGGGDGVEDAGLDADLDADALEDADLDAGADGDEDADHDRVETGPDGDRSDGDEEVDADVEPGPPGPFVLLHLADSHIGAQEIGVPALALAVTEGIAACRPALTVVTGDLVDQGYDEGMWGDYADATSGLSSDQIIEVPGNHDTHDNYTLAGFRGGSVTGRATGEVYGVHLVEGAGRTVRVVATNTASSGNRLQDLTGYLESSQTDALLDAIAADRTPVDWSVVLGHHPLRGLNGLDLHGTGDNLRAILGETAASAYLFGHVHSFWCGFVDGVLHVQAPTLGNPSIVSGDPGFDVLALDEHGPALRRVAFDVIGSYVAVRWPVVLVTRPADPDLAGGNPGAVALPRGSTELVRAVVLCPDAPDDVSFRVDEGDWQPMAPVSSWYEGAFETGFGLSLVLEVRAVAHGGVDSHAVRVDLH